MLGQAHEANLARRRPAAHRRQARGVDPILLQRRPQRLSQLVAPSRTDDAHRQAQGRQVRRHVAGAAQAGLLVLEVEHRHRGLRAQPVGMAVHVAVEHEIPDHDRLAASQALHDVDQAGCHGLPSHYPAKRADVAPGDALRKPCNPKRRKDCKIKGDCTVSDTGRPEASRGLPS